MKMKHKERSILGRYVERVTRRNLFFEHRDSGSKLPSQSEEPRRFIIYYQESGEKVFF